MEEYRIEMKVKNNLLFSKIEEYGYTSIFQFCKAHKIAYPSLTSFINMRKSIFDSHGKLRPFVIKLCKLLNCLPEELFTASQAESELKTNKKTLKVNEAEMRFMLEQSDSQKLLEDHYQEDQLSHSIEDALKTLTPREQKIIEMRMGLGDYAREHTLEEVGNEIGVQRERIRQIEAKALRKLRDPKRAEKLRLFLKDDHE